MQDTQQQRETPDWLLHLQKNSWEPEVIISGLTLAFFFAFPKQIFSFAVFLIQDAGVSILGAWLVLIYLSLALNVLKIFLVVHLVLRFAWAGLLGVSYAFPEGVRNDRLFKISAVYQYQHPVDMVLRLERLCSMAFAFPLVLGLSVIALTLYLGLLIGASQVFNWGNSTFYYVFMGTLFVIPVVGLLGQKVSFFKKNASKKVKGIYSSVQALYQSNLGKWAMMFYALFIMVLAAPFVYMDTQGFQRYFIQTGLSDEDKEWPDAEMLYMDMAPSGKRFPRLMLPSRTVQQNQLTVYLAHLENGQTELDALNRLYADSLLELGWKRPKAQTDLYRLFIDDVEIAPRAWQQVTFPGTGQRSYAGTFVVPDSLEGPRMLRVARHSYSAPFLNLSEQVRLRTEWVLAPIVILRGD